MSLKATKTQLKNGVKLKIGIRGIYALKRRKIRKRTPLIEIQRSEKH